MSSIFANQAASGGSLFGSNTANNAAPSGGSLFGNTNTQNNPTNAAPSLFGNLQNNAQTQASTNTSRPSLFGTTAPQTSGTSLFGGNVSQPQQQSQTSGLQPSAMPQGSASTAQTFSGFNSFISAAQIPPDLSLAQQQDFARLRLTQAGLSSVPNEKSIPDQIQTIMSKWDPNSQSTLLQTYLYNVVSNAYAPFYYKNPDDDERSWERALAEAPKMPEESGQRLVPVLVRGFYALGTRVEYQAKFIAAMQARLHEMNNSLTAVMDAHRQRITVNLDTSRRQHIDLSQRCLRLAVKVQILRNRGYSLDAQEEVLRKQLLALEQQVMDPSFQGREEEIWARMVSLRERTRWLEEEGKRLGQQAENQQTQGLPEEIIQRTRQILKDYDAQLKRLAKELEEVKKEYEVWEEGQQAGGR